MHLEIPFNHFTRDPAAITNSNPLYGLLSNIGILIWCASATCCFLTYTIKSNWGSSKITTNFWLVSGLITSMLLLDDLFMLHEELFPNVLQIPEKAILASYFILIAAYLVNFGKIILKTRFLFLLLAFGLFGISVIADILNALPFHFLIEDGSKFLGIVSWAIYFTTNSMKSIKSASISQNKERAASLTTQSNLSL
ncbi:hypothetical protein Q0590_17570 [Rhodocytophaga aerolata]|uniref:Oxidase n=2 Tax=Rhodocytophaga aerolata TaxID=455078 RepID=A0ABT8R7L7_9BACT|nr:hypothetical protein [Rhodocytophaga aerolata]MDO1448087.1 hypothetical protein [Rhodocytophaga aerolata]